MRSRITSLALARLGVAVVAGAMAGAVLIAGPAAAVPITPGLGTPAVEGVYSEPVWIHELFELRLNHRVVHWHYVEGQIDPEDLGGYAVGGVAATLVRETLEVVTVRGADGAVWLRERPVGGRWTGWRSLGGHTDDHPAVTSFALDNTSFLLVLVRGGDGAIWERLRGPSGWSPGWRRVGGRATSAPAAVGTLAAIRGQDGQVWTAIRAGGLDGSWSRWTRAPRLPSGLRAASEPGLDATLSDPRNPAIYVRGSDGAAWSLAGLPGELAWESLGGQFTSGVISISHSDGVVGGPFVYARGLNGRLYEKRGSGDWHLIGW